MVKLEAIVPKKYTSAGIAKKGLRNILETFAFEAQRDLQKYPAAQPWKSTPPKSGPRKDGRRTGTLGKNWGITAKTGTSITVSNHTPYASYVQGPKDKGGREGGQIANMRERGWPNVSDVGEAAKKRAALRGDVYPD